MSFFRPRPTPAATAAAGTPPPDAPTTWTANVRDLSIASRDAIDQLRGPRPREAYLREMLERLVDSATTSANRRFGWALNHLMDITSKSDPITLSKIARHLNHDSVAEIDKMYRGEAPVTFSAGDAVCNLYGLSSTWLNDGGYGPFAQRALHDSPSNAMTRFHRYGIKYSALYFVLENAARGEFALYGKTGPHCYSLLLSGNPVHASVGGTGSRHVTELGFLLALVTDLPNSSHDSYANASAEFSSLRPYTQGFEVGEEQYRELVGGEIHPDALFSACGTHRNDWIDDFPDIECNGGSGYPENWVRARALFVENMRAAKVQTNAQLVAEARKLLAYSEIYEHEVVKLLLATAPIGDSKPIETEDDAKAIIAAAKAREWDAAWAIQHVLHAHHIGRPSWLPRTEDLTLPPRPAEDPAPTTS